MDFAAISEFILSARTSERVHKLLDLSLSNVKILRMIRSSAIKDMSQITLSTDIFVSNWTGPVVKEIPHLKITQPIHNVEHALFNVTNRFFNAAGASERHKALKSYLIIGFVIKDLDVITHSL